VAEEVQVEDVVHSKQEREAGEDGIRYLNEKSKRYKSALRVPAAATHLLACMRACMLCVS
jgi:hypothetical protein